MELLRIYTDEGEVVVRKVSTPRSYEAMVILKPHLSDEQVAEAIKSFENMIVETYGGEMISVENWGKRRFAYEMDKEREGIYVILSFKVLPQHAEKINRALRLDPRVHRHMIVRLNKKED